jgi:hypothetical protein
LGYRRDEAGIIVAFVADANRSAIAETFLETHWRRITAKRHLNPNK